MQFAFTPEQEAFRKEVQEFLRTSMPAGWLPRNYIAISEDEWRVAREFDLRLAVRGWITPRWPRAYGGLEMSAIDEQILNEELALAGAPDGGARGHGAHFVGPAILEFGTEEQKRRFLPPIVTGDEIWAQCFSEDSAGSDMANIQTTARREGDDYILNGTKLWTGQGHRAEYAIVTARTGDGPKHRSISLFMVDLRSEGVSIEPIWTLPRYGRVNKEVFDDVRVPATNRLGEEHQAWPVMVAVMNHERGNITIPATARRILSSFVRAAAEAPAGSHLRESRKDWRLEAADLWVEIEIARLLNYRITWLSETGRHPDYEASIAKLLAGHIQQRLGQLLVNAHGLYGQIAAPEGPTGDTGDWFTDFWLHGVQATIVSGSSEIMRNVIATRGLGLPRG